MKHIASLLATIALPLVIVAVQAASPAAPSAPPTVQDGGFRVEGGQAILWPNGALTLTQPVEAGLYQLVIRARIDDPDPQSFVAGPSGAPGKEWSFDGDGAWHSYDTILGTTGAEGWQVRAGNNTTDLLLDRISIERIEPGAPFPLPAFQARECWNHPLIPSTWSAAGGATLAPNRATLPPGGWIEQVVQIGLSTSYTVEIVAVAGGDQALEVRWAGWAAAFAIDGVLGSDAVTVPAALIGELGDRPTLRLLASGGNSGPVEVNGVCVQ